MTVVRMRGLNRATKTLADGRRETYWYAWRGGPRLQGRPGSPDFIRSYHEALKSRKAPTASNLAALVAKFRASPEWEKTAPSTKREWNRWLDLIALGPLGHYGYDALNTPEVGQDIVDWRDGWSATPRTADYAVQVMSRVLGWAKRRHILKINAAEGIEKLYDNDRSDVIWDEDEISRYVLHARSPEASYIVPLACLTGLRREDLATLKWSEVGELAIVKATSKSRLRKKATIPILAETRELLKEIKTRRELSAIIGQLDTVLTNTRGKPWTPSGLSHAVAAFGGKRLHDCRGTFVTRLRRAGLTASKIADIVGWEGDRVERILATYVDQDEIVRAIVAEIARGERP